jgi:hypothetical protein
MRATILSLIAMLCFMGCSKGSGSSSKAKRLVPATAAEVIASPEYKLEYTTKSGLKIYVRELTPEMARSIPVNSPDFEFLNSDKPSFCYLAVSIRVGKIITDKDHDPDESEIIGFNTRRDKKTEERLKEATTKR